MSGIPSTRPKHDADHGKSHEGGGLAGVAFVVPAQATVAADPGHGPVDDPAPGQDHEAVQARARLVLDVSFGLRPADRFLD